MNYNYVTLSMREFKTSKDIFKAYIAGKNSETKGSRWIKSYS